MTGTRYSRNVKEEALTLYLGGQSLMKISNILNEQYDFTLHASTIKRWADKNGWQVKLIETKEILSKRAQKRAVDSLTVHINTLRVVQSEFLKKARDAGVAVSTGDMINTIRLLMQLEHGEKLHTVLAKDMALEIKDILKEAKVTKTQQNKILQLLAQRMAMG